MKCLMMKKCSAPEGRVEMSCGKEVDEIQSLWAEMCASYFSCWCLSEDGNESKHS